MMNKALFKAFLLTASAGFLVSNGPAPKYDLVVRDGVIVDGSGEPERRGDVAIKDGMIVAVGKIKGRGASEIDAEGLYVTPGFIDMMDQSGEVFLESGTAENKLMMGVTTVISGEGGVPVDAADLPAYFNRLETQGIGVNFGTYYAGHQARAKVIGQVDREATPAELEAMRGEVRAAMDAGAFGVSSALIYPPSSFQSTDELIALAEVAGQCGGFYASHIRDESKYLLSAIDEAIRIGKEAGVKVEIFHLKAAYAPGWGVLMPQAVAKIEAAREQGLDIAADVYPYTAGGTGIDATVPTWVWADGISKGVERLQDPAIRERLKAEVAGGSLKGWSNLVEAAGGWSNVVLANSHRPETEYLHGKSFEEIGALLGKHPADAAWDILLAGAPNRAMALYFMMSEEDIETALLQPWTSIGSDASASVRMGEVDALGLPHPRAYGTFPRIIAEYVKRRQILTLEQAVHKMTGWPAKRMGLSDRGLVRKGMKADLTIFDLEELDDRASWESPTAAPEGIRTVIVNGQIALDDGHFTGVLNGRVLKHECK